MRGKPTGGRGTTARAALVAILILAVAVRVAAALYLGNTVTAMPGIADQLSYHNLALRVLDGHGFSFGVGWWPATPANQPTAHWSYLYTLFLAAVYGLAGPLPLAARLLQACAVGVLQPWLTFRVATRVFGERVGAGAALLSAAYPYFVYYGAALMTEAFCFVALLWALDVAMRLDGDARSGSRTWLFVQLGLALSAAVLLRQAALLVTPIVFGWLAWRAWARQTGSTAPGRRYRGLAGLGATLLVMALCIAPWTIRNYAAFDRFVLLNTNAGFAFYWGNHPIHGTDFVPILPGEGAYGRLIPNELRGLNEAELDSALLRRGVAIVSGDPWRFLRLSLSRAGALAGPGMSGSGTAATVAKLAFVLLLPFMLIGVALVLLPERGRATARRAWSPGALLVVGVASTYLLAHVLTWTLVRYRLPVDAMLMPFAAYALVAAAERAVQALPARLPRAEATRKTLARSRRA